MQCCKRVIEKVILLPALSLLLSCATTQLQPGGADRTIDMGSYSVEAPPGEGWQSKIQMVSTRQKDTGIITFIKEKWEPLTLPRMNIGTTLIKVFRNEMAPQGWHFSEEEAADDFRNNEEKIMTEELVKKGTYELKDVKKGAATIGGKKFYTMSYKTTTGSFWGQFVEGGASYHAVESALYLFFPPDFKKTHIFYGFLISDYYLRGHLYVTKKTDLAQIYPVINSFRIISPPVEFPVGMNGELLSAAAEGNISNIKNLVNKGADVNARSDTGWTPLMYLSAIGNKEVASLLIEKGADVNQKNNQGQTPLFLAAHWGHSELAGLLIGKNADINAQMDDGWPVLTDAIDMHRVEIAKMLIDKGADVNLKSKKGWTALMAASLKNHPDIVRLLIEKGADVNATDEKDTSALTIAKRSGHVEIVRLLKEAGAKE